MTERTINGSDGLLDSSIIEELGQLREDDGTSLLEKLVEVWEPETRDKLVRLSESFERGDAEEVERTAHSIHGASVSIGASRFAGAVFRFEHSARERRLASAGEDLAQLEELFEETRAAFRRRTR